jgi:ferredoxin-type protein NapF
VVIGETCFAFQGIACMSCRDACAPGAIRFTLARGGARPELDLETCTGCGDCLPVCPAGAIASLSPAEAAHG